MRIIVLYAKRGDFLSSKKRVNIKKIILTVLIAVFLLVFTFVIIVYSKIDKKIDISLFKNLGSTVSKICYFDYEDRQNRIGQAVELKDEAIFLERSEWKSIYSIPTNLKNAFVAIEDKRFFEHHGVDWLRTGKAMLNYIFRFDKTGYGGSTITQQLIKNVTGENEVSAKRKIEEIFRAINIEKNLSKNEIFEAYLNVVYMSQNCYGVGAAAELYFNKNVEDLTLAQCATLAAIVQNPSKYDPYKNLENNRQRRITVLNEMLSQGYISKEEYDEAVIENVVISDQVENRRNSGIYSWYTETLINDVAKDMAKAYNLNVNAARNLILKGGYTIYSVMDLELQNRLEKIYENYMAYIDNQNGTFPQSSCVIIDPYTSDVLALVGGIGKKEGNLVFNRATSAKRPPGSVLKPLSVYAPGLEEKIFNYATVYDDTPIKLENGDYWPKNSPNQYRGLINVSYAVEHSLNTVAVKALRDLGISNSKKYLKMFGVNINDSLDSNESSLALGQLSNGESLLNITNAYAAFVNGGEVAEPKTYLYVEDALSNKVLEKKEKKEKVISEENAYIMTTMLKGVVESGTASNIRLKNNMAVAGKTGTSSNNEDKWFVGYTPYYVCGVWTGYDMPKHLSYVKNPSCEIFDAIMEYAHKEMEYTDFQMPFGICESEYCVDSGKYPTDACRNDVRGDRTRVGYFLYDDIPKDECHIHQSVYIDNDGYITGENTPFWTRRKVSLLDYVREVQNGIQILDDEYLISNRKKN